jgi:hypothetical protein
MRPFVLEEFSLREESSLAGAALVVAGVRVALQMQPEDRVTRC